MNREQIISLLKNDKPLLSEQFGVEEIALFGSYARNEQTAGCDIDILVKIKKPEYNLLMGVQRFLEERFKNKIDIVRVDKHLTPRFYSIIGKDIIYV
jgi:predicted nucleotidyltransferase